MYPRNVPTQEKFENIAQEAGINADSHVVVYSSSDRCGYFLSGRGWWSFKVEQMIIIIIFIYLFIYLYLKMTAHL